MPVILLCPLPCPLPCPLSLSPCTAFLLMEITETGELMSTLLSSAASAFDASQLVLNACVGYMAVDEALLEVRMGAVRCGAWALRQKHRPAIMRRLEERQVALQRYQSGKSERLKAEAAAIFERMSLHPTADGRPVTTNSLDDSILPSPSAVAASGSGPLLDPPSLLLPPSTDSLVTNNLLSNSKSGN
ncbi:unnamed protein product, partial [Closterium sp. NIES-53]